MYVYGLCLFYLNMRLKITFSDYFFAIYSPNLIIVLISSPVFTVQINTYLNPDLNDMFLRDYQPRICHEFKTLWLTKTFTGWMHVSQSSIAGMIAAEMRS